MITVTFYPLDTERYGHSFVREFPDGATWERVRASLTGTYHSIEVSYPPDGSNYHDPLCRCPGCDPQSPDERITDELTDDEPNIRDRRNEWNGYNQEMAWEVAEEQWRRATDSGDFELDDPISDEEMKQVMNEPSPLDEDYHRTFFDGLDEDDLGDHPF